VKSIIVSACILFFTSSLAFAEDIKEGTNSLKTSAGTLQIVQKDINDAKIFLDGKKIKGLEDKYFSIDFVKKFVMPEQTEVVVLFIPTGGTACAGVYEFLTIKDKLLTYSGSPENCSDLATIEQKGATIDIAFPTNRPSKKEIWRYQNGKIVKQKLPVTSTNPKPNDYWPTYNGIARHKDIYFSDLVRKTKGLEESIEKLSGQKADEVWNRIAVQWPIKVLSKDEIVGEACAAHMCDTDDIVIYVKENGALAFAYTDSGEQSHLYYFSNFSSSMGIPKPVLVYINKKMSDTPGLQLVGIDAPK
jgi:hypothetical protein